MGLLLQARDIRPDGLGWRWLLTHEESGEPRADHTVELDPAAPELAGFTDLHRYLRWRADPDRRAEHEAELVAQVGGWIGAQALGEDVGRAIVAAAPATVRVAAPASMPLGPLGPLELAYVDGVPLARRGDVSLVYELGPPGGHKRPVGERLRMVAVFSLPTEATVLGLRRERYELTRRIRRLAAHEGRAIDLQVLQYGVTRKRLVDALTAEQGPDVLHLSGHGRVGELLLETTDGAADRVSTEELLALLSPARARVKLAVVSACESAAGKVAETLGLLGLTEAAAQVQAEAAEVTGAETGVARTLAEQLDCAVVAMRYPVYDEFAIALADQLYDGMFRLDLPLDRALPRAVVAAAGDAPSLSRPAISIATPTLVGARAVGLKLVPPTRPTAGEPIGQPRLVGFPPEPERFVGRSRVMAKASAALAPGSRRTGVLFHGMAGAGKTWCAVELAYRHQDAFAHGQVFWQASTREGEWQGALAKLASSLDERVPGLRLVDKLGTEQRFRAFLPVLSRILAEHGILLVLDNLETLLTPEGAWRDPRWTELVAALVNHEGESRVVLTSRVLPTGLDHRVLVEPVHALPRNEAVLLARELPRLGNLLHLDAPATRHPDPAVATDRTAVTEVLRLVQGHPKLLELADAAAADRETLARHLAAAQTAAEPHGASLAAFFGQGESSLDDKGFLDMLFVWTTSTVATLPDPARLLLQFLCLLEDDDRRSDVVGGSWAGLWGRLDRPGTPPDPARILDALVGAALVDPVPLRGDGAAAPPRPAGGHTGSTPSDGAPGSTPVEEAAAPAPADPHAGPSPVDGSTDPLVRYRIHPGVAEAVRGQLPDGQRAAVDTELAAWWTRVADQAATREGGEHTAAVVHAGLAAAPYLLRRHDWDTAAPLLEHAHLRDRSPPVVQAVLPHLDHIATTTGDLRHLGVYARVLATVDPIQAEQLLRRVIDTATATGDYATASTFGGDLGGLLRGTGRLDQALAVADQKAAHTRLAELGPWTHLNDRRQRLATLYRMGQVEQVLTEVDTLREDMARLPDQPGPTETVTPWMVREAILQLGVYAAVALDRWQQALDLNTERRTSQHHRGAGPHRLARTRLDDYGPLLRLGRIDQADTLLRECQQVFEHHHDIPALGRVLTARADVAAERGHHAEAVGLEQAALRMNYVHPDPDAVSVSHHNLAGYLAATGDPAGQVAHRLAAALLRHLAGMQHRLATSMHELAGDLRAPGEQAPVAGNLAELTSQVEQVDGVRFRDLVTSLQPDPATVQTALDGIIEAARTQAAEAEQGSEPA